jgi:hypothetical protein
LVKTEWVLLLDAAPLIVELIRRQSPTDKSTNAKPVYNGSKFVHLEHLKVPVRL